jgi:hypothetical protein
MFSTYNSKLIEHTQKNSVLSAMETREHSNISVINDAQKNISTAHTASSSAVSQPPNSSPSGLEQ